MAEPFLTRPRLVWLGIVLGSAAVLVVVVIGVGFVASQFMQYNASGGSAFVSSPMQVMINSPHNGAQLDVGETLMVDATAFGPVPFVSMELWVDGELQGVQDAPNGGANPYKGQFAWTPKEVGVHSLVAAGVNADEQIVLSPQVIVLVTPDGSGVDYLVAGSDVPAVLPAADGGAGAPPSPPGAGDSIGPANDWSGSPGDWVASLTADEGPMAPRLAAAAVRCGARLSIQDLSDNEEGFAVYRHMPNDPDWLKISTLSSQSEFEWLTYEDSSALGVVSYYVSAFNSQSEATSNLAYVEVEVDDCPANVGEINAFTVEVVRLLPTTAADMGYCYRSFDGVNWSRWPRLGFLPQGEDGALVGGPLELRLLNGINGQPLFHTFDLMLECWGWQGGELYHLGDVTLEGMDPQDPGPQFVEGEGISAEINVQTGNALDGTEFFPMSGEGDDQFQISEAGEDILPEFLFALDIPIPYLFWSDTTHFCQDFLPPDAQNLAGQIFYCFPYPEYDPNLGSEYKQPYLHWYPNGHPGMEDPDCIVDGPECNSYEELLALAEGNGGNVGFEVRGVNNIWGEFTFPIVEPYLFTFVVPPFSCETGMDFNVRMWYQPGTEDEYQIQVYDPIQVGVQDDSYTVGEQDHPQQVDSSTLAEQNYPQVVAMETFYGPWSDTKSIPCLPLPDVATQGVIQFLDVTFTNLTMSAVDDNDTHSQTIEVYGWMKINTPPKNSYELNPYAVRRYLHFGQWHEQPDGSADDSVSLWGPDFEGDQRKLGCPQILKNGSYGLSDLYFCQSTKKRQCYDGDIDKDTWFAYDNNTVKIAIQDGDALAFEIKLIDYDENSDHDLVCEGAVLTPAKSLAAWGATQGETYTIFTSETGSGKCDLSIMINASGPP